MRGQFNCRPPNPPILNAGEGFRTFQANEQISRKLQGDCLVDRRGSNVQ